MVHKREGAVAPPSGQTSELRHRAEDVTSYLFPGLQCFYITTILYTYLFFHGTSSTVVSPESCVKSKEVFEVNYLKAVAGKLQTSVLLQSNLSRPTSLVVLLAMASEIF